MARGLNADVICFGGGGTGLAAAVTAASAGARVVIVERRHTLGGNSRLGTGLFAAESVVQERLNIRAPRDELFRLAMEYAHWSLDPLLVRTWIDRSAEVISWLESLGLRFGAVPSLPFGQFPPTWHCPEGGGPALIEVLVSAAEAKGVQFLLSTEAHEILRDGTDGPVVGVLCRGKDGEELEVRAPAVVVGAGGFGGNLELLKRHRPGFEQSWHLLGVPNPGTGISAAHAAGAEEEGMGNLQFEAPSAKGTLFLNHAIREPRALLVNADGMRFVDEGLLDNPFESANALLRQPGAISYTLLDRRLRDEVLRRQGNLAAGPVYEAQARNPERFEAQLEGGGAVVAELDAVAAVIGASAETLRRTVCEYNQACERGHDPLFAKDRAYLWPLTEAPFYVLEGRPGFLETIGGIKIDARMRVIGRDGAPIPGLWAGGADTGGWEGETYCFRTAGKTLSFALVSGRIAAEGALAATTVR